MEANIGKEIDQFLSANGEYQTGLSLLMKFHKNRMLIASLIRRESEYNYDKIRYELGKYLKTINYERQKQHTANPTTESETKESFHNHAGNQAERNTIQHIANRTDKRNEGIGIKQIVADSGKRNVGSQTQPITDDSETNHGSISSDNGSFNHHGDYQRNVLGKIFSEKEKLLYARRGQCHSQLKITSEVQKRKELCFEILAIQKELDQIHSKQEALEQDLLQVDEAVAQMDAKTYRTYKNKVSYISKYKAELETCTDAKRIEIINNYIATHQTWINELFKS
jgi:hypothetical protein